MSDVLELIARRQPEIARQWGRALRAQPESAYARHDEQTLAEIVSRSCRALLAVMQTGRTDRMEQELVASARRRIQDGISYSDSVLAWMLYRQIVQQVLAEDLHEPELWDQFVDRVDGVLRWVMAVLYDAYNEAGKLDR